jgi:hypothetical protein
MGWSAGTTAKMAKRYGHIGSEVQRAALESLAGEQQPASGDEAETDQRADSDAQS